MQKTIKTTLALVAILSASTAFAQAPATHRPAPPNQAQPNGPQKGMTRAEVLARAAERFDATDTNKDGVLTPDEMRAAREQSPNFRNGPRGPQAGGPEGIQARPANRP
jgi:hypothetical protein